MGNSHIHARQDTEDIVGGAPEMQLLPMHGVVAGWLLGDALIVTDRRRKQ